MSSSAVLYETTASGRARRYYLPGADVASSWYELVCGLLAISRSTHSRVAIEALFLAIHRGLTGIGGVRDVCFERGVLCITRKPDHFSWDHIHSCVMALLTEHFGRLLDTEK